LRHLKSRASLAGSEDLARREADEEDFALVIEDECFGSACSLVYCKYVLFMHVRDEKVFV